MIKVSDYVIQYLESLGVLHMFMLPGGGAMHLNDSLGNSKKIQYVVCLHAVSYTHLTLPTNSLV